MARLPGVPRPRPQVYHPKPFASQYLLLLLVGAIAATGLYLLLAFAQGVKPISTTFDAQQSTARIELLKVALASTAGIAAIAGLYVAYRKQRNEEAGAVREQDRVFTERFGAAAELLASEKAAVRLAGLNALARLADDSLRDRVTCLETVCAYLRLPMEVPAYSTDRFSISEGGALPGTWELGDREHWADTEEWEVRRSALTLVTQRLKPAYSETFWAGAKVDLRGAVLIEPDLSDCRIESDFDANNSFVVTNRGGVVWDNLTTEGTVSFIGATFACGLSIRASHIQDRMYFHTARLLSPVTFLKTRFHEHLSLSAAEISELTFDGVEFGPFTTLASSTITHGPVVIKASDVSNVCPLQGDRLSGPADSARTFLDMSGIVAPKGIVITECKMPDVIRLEGSRIGDKLAISGCELDIRGADLSDLAVDQSGHKKTVAPGVSGWLLDDVTKLPLSITEQPAAGRTFSYSTPTWRGDGYWLIAEH